MTASTATPATEASAKKASAAPASIPPLVTKHATPAKATRTRKAPAAKAAPATTAAPAATQTAQKAPRAAKGTPRSAKATKAAPAKVVSSDLVADLTARRVLLQRVRKNGTVRAVPYLAAGSKARKSAEQIVALRDSGKTIKQITEELHLSTASVRRAITGLLLAQDIEGGAGVEALVAKGLRVEHKAEAKAS